jgi:hypothetical protein
MIQRIQSIFLLIVAVSMLLLNFFPIWVIEPEEGQVYSLFSAYFLVPVTGELGSAKSMSFFPYVFVSLLAALSVIISIVEIFKYKNRLTQIKLGALNALLIAASLVLTVYFIIELQEEFGIYGQYKFGSSLPVVALVFNLLANRFIRRDEKLVRSVDRLR